MPPTSYLRTATTGPRCSETSEGTGASAAIQGGYGGGTSSVALPKLSTTRRGLRRIYWQGALGGTCFDQREQQVIIFDPDTGGMKAFIAPGDLYKDPSRWTTEDIARLTED